MNTQRFQVGDIVIVDDSKVFSGKDFKSFSKEQHFRLGRVYYVEQLGNSETYFYHIVFYASIVANKLKHGLFEFDLECTGTDYTDTRENQRWVTKLEDAQQWIEDRIQAIETARTNLTLLSESLHKVQAPSSIPQMPWKQKMKTEK